MPEQTVLAFDYGERKIGVAIGTTLIRQARPLEIIAVQTRQQRFARIEAVLRKWGADSLVVGLSLALDGSDQPATLGCRRFANQLHGRYGLPVTLVDERHSSMEAQAILGTNAADDAMAAAVILQRYFDALPGNLTLG